MTPEAVASLEEVTVVRRRIGNVVKALSTSLKAVRSDAA